MMNKLVKFNINNYVTVTLTQSGAEAYNKRYDDIKDMLPDDFPYKFVEPGHVLKAQLWTLFQDFGPHIGSGLMNPFEQCIMEFDMKDFYV